MNLTDDLTNGIIWKQLTALALPLIWGNILQQMYNTIDSFVVGHYRLCSRGRCRQCHELVSFCHKRVL